MSTPVDPPPDDPLGDRGKAIVAQVTENMDEALKPLADSLAKLIADQTSSFDEVDTALTGLAESVNKMAEQLAVLPQVASDVAESLEILREQGKPEETWRDQEDLIDASFRPVFGIHTGGDSKASSNPDVIEDAMGQVIQAAPIYVVDVSDNIEQRLTRMLARDTVPRLELCLPHILTSAGFEMANTFWKDVPIGLYDDLIASLLAPVDMLGVPILLSLSHEPDLRSEDGASPKSTNPPASTYCGAYEDFAEFWNHVSALAREFAPKARLFLNFSGGYADAPTRWNAMLPEPETYDFFGWDPYNMYGKQQGAEWQSFESRMKMFGRWDWYKRTIPDVPIIIGETGTCEGPGGDKDAGKWVTDMVEFMVTNRWQGIGTGGGISQIHYFSHHYSDHPRCLDDAGTHPGCDSGQRAAVLAQIGSDTRLAWAG